MHENRAISMEETGRLMGQSGPFLVFHLSWFAQVSEIWRFVVRLLLCGIAATAAGFVLQRVWQFHTLTWMPGAGVVIAGLWTIYSVAFKRSIQLYTDEIGVWVQSGVFPWEKGISGVQWRDLGQAGYTQGLGSWMLRSYDVRVSQRFTTGTELFLRNVHRGNLAVEHINGIMAQLQGRVLPS